GSMVAGFSGVVGNLPAGSQVAGMPQMERGLYARVVAAWKRLPELLRRVRRIEERLGIEREE
ncbi:MAG: UDP-3-O-(3-hydroxymyristoyl)glucosamine N-acyltransferase, partial [Deltaproteobacteria bacterium]|nr:UDP-3-O-(3-hydroxymyristoyl)glucosamine N-acyltransferase [Deltaproteobacteria bacterium]